MVRDLQGRRLLITGASSGLGRCLAERAVLRGARVALVARSPDKLEELAESLKSRNADAIAVPADITAAADRQRLLQTVVDRFGGLDVLVNNAAVASWAHFANSSEDILRKIMEVNFFAPAELIRLAIPLLMRGQQPAIVNVSSMCGRRGLPSWSEYSASKFALCGLTEALRGEMVRFGIDVLLVLPGLTDGQLQEHLLLSQGRENIDFAGGLALEEIAEQILEAIRKNRTETVLGREARWLLRVNRFLPRLLDHVISRRVRKLYEHSAREASDV